MTYKEEQELLNLTRQNNILLQQIYKLNNQNSFDIDVLANLFAGLFNRR